MSELIKITNLRKTYDGKRYVLDGLNFSIGKGEIKTIFGASGCGKSTFLNIVGLLDNYTSGEYLFCEININPKRLNDYYKYRAQDIGFIFQSYFLIDSLSVNDNILMPFLYNGIDLSGSVKKTVDKLLDSFDMLSLKNKKVSLLSGGERQRVAIMRAIIKEPKLIIADEPTGNLDESNTDLVVKAFKYIAEKGTAVIVVTHNKFLSFGTDTTYTLRGGKLYNE